MKLIILEGQDNLGKTTIIREICKNYKTYIVRKFSNPPSGLTPFEQDKFQQENFLEEFRLYVNLKKLSLFENSVMIWDRSHIGEQVYGPLYRGTNPTEWLRQLESLFSRLNGAYLILLHGDYDFVIQNEDGLSLKLSEARSNIDIDIDDEAVTEYIKETKALDEASQIEKIKLIEDALFRYAFDNSLIEKKLELKVDNSFTSEFRPLEELMEEVNRFINDEPDPTDVYLQSLKITE